MNKIKNFLYTKARNILQCSALLVAIYAANTSCILIFHQEEMPATVKNLNRLKNR